MGNDDMNASTIKMATAGCRICRDILVGFMLTHGEETCPLAKAAYCSYCASYGHFATACNRAFEAKKVQANDAARVMKAIAQEKKKEKEKEKAYLEIIDTDNSIRAYLMSKSIEPAQKKKENIKILQKYAEDHDLLLVMVCP